MPSPESGNTGANKRGKAPLLWPLHSSKLMCVSRSVLSDSATPWMVNRQAPMSEFSRQEYWSGLPFPPPGDLPDPETESASLVSPALAGGFFTTIASREDFVAYTCTQ